MENKTGPLQGVKVVACSTAQAGTVPYMLMADLGADVIKVEMPGTGDPSRTAGELKGHISSFFETNNRGVKSITLNLKTDEGRAILHRLIKDADVFGQNFRPGAAEKNGFGYEELKKINPGLIYCSMTGFGKTGPKSQHPAYDSVIQAFSGLMELNGLKSTGPLRVGPAVVDYGTGIHAAFAISSALYRRQITGKGIEIDVSMLDAALMLMTSTVSETIATGISKPNYGNDHPDYAGYGTFKTSDRDLVIGAFTKKQTQNLFKALKLENISHEVALMSKKQLKKNKKKFKKIISKVVICKTADYWEEVLNKHHVPASKIRTLSEALDSEQIKSRAVLQNSFLKNNLNAKRLPTAAFSYSDGSPKITKPAQKIGKSDKDIRKIFS